MSFRLHYERTAHVVCVCPGRWHCQRLSVMEMYQSTSVLLYSSLVGLEEEPSTISILSFDRIRLLAGDDLSLCLHVPQSNFLRVNTAWLKCGLSTFNHKFGWLARLYIECHYPWGCDWVCRSVPWIPWLFSLLLRRWDHVLRRVLWIARIHLWKPWCICSRHHLRWMGQWYRYLFNPLVVPLPYYMVVFVPVLL